MAEAIVTLHVYLVRRDDLHKIGHSGDPAGRLGQLVPGYADGELLHSFPSANAIKVEGALHRRFAGRHVTGEWFRLIGDEVRSICRLGRIDAPEDLPPDLQPPAEVRNPCWSRLREPNVSVTVRVSDALLAALRQLATQNRRTRNQEILIAIEDRLRANDLWPEDSPPGK